MANVWDRFDQAAEACYEKLEQGERPPELWNEAFGIFCRTLEKEKKGKTTLEDLEDETEWNYGFSGFLEDYLDDLEQKKEYRTLLEASKYLLKAFSWIHGDFLDLGEIRDRCIRRLEEAEQ
ncbi:MAG: hypothetical protein IKT15_00735 [Firmicutes bacterium]|nr:hypothetical protein [Bacillota bacterium]